MISNHPWYQWTPDSYWCNWCGHYHYANYLCSWVWPFEPVPRPRPPVVEYRPRPEDDQDYQDAIKALEG